eukprot:750825-Amphidinium_carterae.1
MDAPLVESMLVFPHSFADFSVVRERLSKVQELLSKIALERFSERFVEEDWLFWNAASLVVSPLSGAKSALLGVVGSACRLLGVVDSAHWLKEVDLETLALFEDRSREQLETCERDTTKIPQK